MNKKQKVLTFLAIFVFVISLFTAPWSARSTLLDRDEEIIAPIFSPPTHYLERVKLRVEVLFFEWIAIGVVYTGFFFLFQTKKPEPTE